MDQPRFVAVAVTYCPLYNSAVVFDRRVRRRVLDFAATGKLRNFDLVMYDCQTKSWWQQFVGEAIIGEMNGKQLAMLPARAESFARYRKRVHDGQILVPTRAGTREYRENPYLATIHAGCIAAFSAASCPAASSPWREWPR